MRDIASGAINEYFEEINVNPDNIGNVNEPIAKSLFDVSKPTIYRVEGRWKGKFVSGLLPDRDYLRRMFGAKDDVDAFKIFLDASRNAKVGLLKEDTFNEYFKLLDTNFEGVMPPQIYAEDGAPYMTASVFVACADGICNASIHRVMVVGAYDARVRVVPRHLYQLLKRREPLPVAVVIGVHPAVLLAAASSPPFGIFELGIAAKLLNSLRVCLTPNYSIPVPCGASIVIEGLLGGEYGPEGPFVDILGVIDGVRNQPILKPIGVYVNRVYEPFYHVIVQASKEHMLFMGFPREASIYDAVSRVTPNVVNVRLSFGGGGWLHAIISIRKDVEGIAKNVILAAFAGHPSLKHVVVVDNDIDIDNPLSVEWAIATRFQADKDLVIVCNSRGSSLDPSSENSLTCKVGIDATKPLGPDKEDKFRRVAPWPM